MRSDWSTCCMLTYLGGACCGKPGRQLLCTNNNHWFWNSRGKEKVEQILLESNQTVLKITKRHCEADSFCNNHSPFLAWDSLWGTPSSHRSTSVPPAAWHLGQRRRRQRRPPPPPTDSSGWWYWKGCAGQTERRGWVLLQQHPSPCDDS